jgi:large subunit ribosomal protein L15
MTKYNELQVSASQTKKRIGRGISAGQGKTAGRGTKGQKARTGKKLGAMFAGGSRTLVTAIPKNPGFKSLRAPAEVVYLDHLNAFNNQVVDNFSLFNADLIASPYQSVKVIARGELMSKIDLQVAGASKSVVAAIVKAGGTFTKTAVPLKMGDKAKTVVSK